MSERDFRKCVFKVWKSGRRVSVHFSASKHFRRAERHELMDRGRIFAVDTESLRTETSPLQTLLIPVHFHDGATTIETLTGTGMLERLFDTVFARPGFAEKAGKPSATAQRRGGGRRRLEPRGRPSNGRDGRRLTIDPVLCVFFNLKYDIGRLFADRFGALRAIGSGASSYRIRISDRYELEVARMVFGSAPSFEFYIRNYEAKTIVRMLGLDLTGYWKTSLASAAKSVGVSEKIDVEQVIDSAYERPLESFTPREWELFKEYGVGDVKSTLELYHRTAELLVAIDPRVVRRTGVIPPSAPGAAAKIVFAKAFDCHRKVGQWERYPAWADQMGCDAYYGGRAFCTKPGTYRRMVSLDLKSAYPFQTALLPDPVTMNAELVNEGAFDVKAYHGSYGVLYVSGEGLDPVMPAFRVHDPENGGRLQYVFGRFENVAVTIPELVIGVLRGALRIDRVHRGVVMRGDAKKSFLRAGMRAFFDIKEDLKNEKALRDMAKLLANSTYGKLIEVQQSDYLVSEHIIMPRFTGPKRLSRVSQSEVFSPGTVARSIAGVFANSGPQDSTYWGEGAAQKKAAREFYARAAARFQGTPDELGPYAVQCYVEALDAAGVERQEGPGCSVADYVAEFKSYRAGAYFFPLYAAQITGATSAMVGLMAACTGALQGDTDSVHVELPDGVDRVDELPGWERYFKVMREAGYPSPRMVGGRWEGGIEEIPGLGAWEQESPAPSVESVLVRPKVYSHEFIAPKDDPKKGIKVGDVVHKQAKHAFAKFHSPEVEAELRAQGRPRDERTKRAAAIRERDLHRAMVVLESGEAYSYETRAAPRQLREAIAQCKPVGEFIKREMTLRVTPDPNTRRDRRTGFVHWKPLDRDEGREIDAAAE